ncbi:MAG: hypothetical protein QOD67_4321 [Caballeronia sp.]|nr:hypothetical protein [Caballeronia sp.]
MLCRRREDGPTGIRQRGNGSIRGSANAANPEACCIDSRANLALLAVVTLAMVLQLFAWPFLLRHWGAQALWLGVPLVVLAPTHWGPIHEAIHGQLLPRRQLSESAGRVLAIRFLLPFDAVRFGHLMHHRFTREPYDRPDVNDSSSNRVRARIHYYARLLGGLYAAELALPVLAFLGSADESSSAPVASPAPHAAVDGPSYARARDCRAVGNCRRRRLLPDRAPTISPIRQDTLNGVVLDNTR